MSDPQVQDVFKTSGVPTHTFVQPQEYARLLLNLRTAGRGLVVEGPSGIGKTTAVENALQEAGLGEDVTVLSARLREDVEYIADLPSLGSVGVVIIDDFHKLSDNLKSMLADYMKTLADRSAADVKVVVVGINRVGENLIQFAHDLANRLDVVPFESNPDDRVEQLIQKGESALNVNLNTKDEIVREAQGSFFLAQMLSLEVCTSAGVLDKQDTLRETQVSFEAIKASVWQRQGRTFRERCERFCRGSRMKKSGRAPYLHILKWLAEGSDWTLDLRKAMRRHPGMSGSVGQVVNKGFLADVVSGDEEISSVLHFDQQSDQLTVEDPLFVFYLRSIPWNRLARDIGFDSVEFEHRYDFALSFAGANRDLAESLFEALAEQEVEVFYDKNEQHRILASNLEEYLEPIYQSEAMFVIPLLSTVYPERVWAKFESEAFKSRFGQNSVIPIWFKDAQPGAFDESRKYGGLMFDPAVEIKAQARNFADILVQKLAHVRAGSA